MCWTTLNFGMPIARLWEVIDLRLEKLVCPSRRCQRCERDSAVLFYGGGSW